MPTNHSTRTYKSLYPPKDNKKATDPDWPGQTEESKASLYREKMSNKLKATVEEIFREGRIDGYHPREIYLCLMDSLSAEANFHRDMARWDTEEEIMG